MLFRSQICVEREINKQGVLISDWAKKKIQTLCDKDQRINSLIQLIGRIPDNANQTSAFISNLEGLFLQKMQTIIDDGYGISEKNGKKRQEIYEIVLIGKVKKEKGKEKVVCDVPLFFDISDWPRFS